MSYQFNTPDTSEAWLWTKLMLTTFADTIGIEQKSAKYEEQFETIKTFCLFIGYPRSGHSLISSVIDAHPNAIMAHRMNSLRYLQAGYSEQALFYMLLRNSQRFAKSGRKLTRYQYDVPHQWQGHFRQLQVIGDQEGKGATQWLTDNPDILVRLMNMTRVRTKFIHVIRNPFDNISTWAVRMHRSLAYTVDRYFALCTTNAWVKEIVPSEDILDVHHEQFVDEPEAGLKALGDFLGLATSDEYLTDCRSIIYQSPHQSRHAAPWTPALIEAVTQRMAEFPFLRGYSYEA
jgi:hypothetical protein